MLRNLAQEAADFLYWVNESPFNWAALAINYWVGYWGMGFIFENYDWGAGSVIRSALVTVGLSYRAFRKERKSAEG